MMNSSPCRPRRRYGPCTPSIGTTSWLWKKPRTVAPATVASPEASGAGYQQDAYAQTAQDPQGTPSEDAPDAR